MARRWRVYRRCIPILKNVPHRLSGECLTKRFRPFALKRQATRDTRQHSAASCTASSCRVAGNMKTESQSSMIARISEALKVPVEEVERAYFAAWHELQAGAKIHDYLALFAARRVTEAFRKQQQSSALPPPPVPASAAPPRYV